MAIERWDPERDGPFSEQALRQKLERRGYLVVRYVYPPGTCFPEHTHAVDKIDAVVSGRFRMATHHLDAVLTAGDCLTVPHGVLHRAEVVGDEPVISLDASRSPREPD
ncbi:MAG TPA: cupin domain-containing protein [Vicinamibacterales bacterium]|nr:cupin domain-containing protein [Vicinamibacterales bacterium]